MTKREQFKTSAEQEFEWPTRRKTGFQCSVAIRCRATQTLMANRFVYASREQAEAMLTDLLNIRVEIEQSASKEKQSDANQN